MECTDDWSQQEFEEKKLTKFESVDYFSAPEC